MPVVALATRQTPEHRHTASQPPPPRRRDHAHTATEAFPHQLSQTAPTPLIPVFSCRTLASLHNSHPFSTPNPPPHLRPRSTQNVFPIRNPATLVYPDSTEKITHTPVARCILDMIKHLHYYQEAVSYECASLRPSFICSNFNIAGSHVTQPLSISPSTSRQRFSDH